MTSVPTINKTLEFSDLGSPAVRPTVRSLKVWLWRWLLTGGAVAVNGRVKRRAYIRRHKMWEYARGLALTGASGPARPRNSRLSVLDVGGGMTAPVFYLASLGDHVVCLDIDGDLINQTTRTARKRRLKIDARTTNLAREDQSGDQLDAPGGFDRIYCFCVIEHIEPPGQTAIARRMGQLLKPGGQLCLTFDFGPEAPSEAPLRTTGQVESIREAVGLPLLANKAFLDTGSRYPLDRRYPDRRYTFGSLFFFRPP